MTRDQIEAAYRRTFGSSLESDLPHLRRLLRSFLRQGRFTAPLMVDRSTVSLEERSFAKFAFLALVTLGETEAIGGPPALEATNPIDVEVTEVVDVDACLAAANPIRRDDLD